jgi:hypothetical protein
MLKFNDNSPEHLARLKKALESARKGNGITNEQLKQKIFDWKTSKKTLNY